MRLLDGWLFADDVSVDLEFQVLLHLRSEVAHETFELCLLISRVMSRGYVSPDTLSYGLRQAKILESRVCAIESLLVLILGFLKYFRLLY